MEDHHPDPRLQGLPELQQQGLVQRAELAAERILESVLAGCSPAVRVLHNHPVLLLDCQFSYQEAEVCQP